MLRPDAVGPDRAGRGGSHRQGLGEEYGGRQDRHALAVERALQSATFLSELAEGLAGVRMYESDPGAPKKLVAAAARLDALAEEGAHRPGGDGAPKRRRRGTA